MTEYLFIHEDAKGRTLYAHPCGTGGAALIIEQGLGLHTVVLDASALARFLKSLAPVVGAEGGAGPASPNTIEEGQCLGKEPPGVAPHPDALVPHPALLADAWRPAAGAAYQALAGEAPADGLVAVVYRVAYGSGFGSGYDAGYGHGHEDGLVAGRAESVAAQRAIEQGAEASLRRAREMLARFASAGPELEDRIAEVLARLDGKDGQVADG